MSFSEFFPASLPISRTQSATDLAECIAELDRLHDMADEIERNERERQREIAKVHAKLTAGTLTTKEAQAALLPLQIHQTEITKIHAQLASGALTTEEAHEALLPLQICSEGTILETTPVVDNRPPEGATPPENKINSQPAKLPGTPGRYAHSPGTPVKSPSPDSAVHYPAVPLHSNISRISEPFLNNALEPSQHETEHLQQEITIPSQMQSERTIASIPQASGPAIEKQEGHAPVVRTQASEPAVEMIDLFLEGAIPRTLFPPLDDELSFQQSAIQPRALNKNKKRVRFSQQQSQVLPASLPFPVQPVMSDKDGKRVRSFEPQSLEDALTILQSPLQTLATNKNGGMISTQQGGTSVGIAHPSEGAGEESQQPTKLRRVVKEGMKRARYTRSPPKK